MDLTTLIVDLLRKKEEEKALNAGGLTAGTPQAQAAARFGAQMTPAEAAAGGRGATPEMLGSGAAQKAAQELLKRKSAPMEYVDSIQ